MFTFTALSLNVIANDCVGFITGSHDKYWEEMYAGVKEAASKYGHLVHYRGLNAETNSEGQGAAVDNFSKLDCSALILAPNHPDRASQVDGLRDKGVVVVFVDRGLAGAPKVPVIATDNYAAGVVAGKEMVQRLPSGARNIAVFRLAEDVDSTSAREKGFIDYIRAQGLNLVLDIYAGTQIRMVKENVIKAMARASAQIDGVFTPNETTTIGAADVLNGTKNSERPILIGFDFSEDIKRLMDAGKLDGVVKQNPYLMGYQAIELIERHRREGEPILSTDVSVEFVKP